MHSEDSVERQGDVIEIFMFSLRGDVIPGSSGLPTHPEQHFPELFNKFVQIMRAVHMFTARLRTGKVKWRRGELVGLIYHATTFGHGHPFARRWNQTSHDDTQQAVQLVALAHVARTM